MANQEVNRGRRRLLTGVVSVVGGAGAATLAVPFLRMWSPSAKAQAAGAPIEADISKIEPGQMLQFEWRGQPVWVVSRTPEMLGGLGSLEGELRDPGSDNIEQQPEYAQNAHRSIKPELLILLGICTHLGCSPKFVPELVPQPFDPNWQGGFFCPCHNSRFDMAGRVYSGVPAPANLKVPPHQFLDDGRVLIGVDAEETA